MSSRRHVELEIEAGRYAELAWTAYADEDNTPIAFGAGDDVLWKLAASEGGASLVALSKTANLNNSQVVVDVLGNTSDPDPANWVPASGRVIIDAADTTGLATTKAVAHYDELILKDAGDSNRLKTIVRGRVVVRPSQT